MVDHTKFGKVALHHLTPLEKFNLVLVDSYLEEKHHVDLKNAHIPYEVVNH